MRIRPLPLSKLIPQQRRARAGKPTKRARSRTTLRDDRQNPKKNLIYQIQRRNKSTGKSNKAKTRFPHIVFAKNIVSTDYPGVTDHVEAFTKQICEVIVGKTTLSQALAR